MIVWIACREHVRQTDTAVRDCVVKRASSGSSRETVSRVAVQPGLQEASRYGSTMFLCYPALTPICYRVWGIGDISASGLESSRK